MAAFGISRSYKYVRFPLLIVVLFFRNSIRSKLNYLRLVTTSHLSLFDHIKCMTKSSNSELLHFQSFVTLASSAVCSQDLSNCVPHLSWDIFMKVVKLLFFMFQIERLYMWNGNIELWTSRVKSRGKPTCSLRGNLKWRLKRWWEDNIKMICSYGKSRCEQKWTNCLSTGSNDGLL